MLTDAKPTVVIVPGLREDVPEHWQSIMAGQLSRCITVPRLLVGKMSCNAWVTLLDRTLASVDGPVILVAHSGGVMMVVHWAQGHRRPIHGALLATPPDFESPLPSGYPTIETLRDGGWLPVPRSPLPFPSIVAASSNDPLGRYERVAELASAWGSRLVDIGAVGHLNPAAGFGPWPAAAGFLSELQHAGRVAAQTDAQA